jgi:hypothetical protein
VETENVDAPVVQIRCPIPCEDGVRRRLEDLRQHAAELAAADCATLNFVVRYAFHFSTGH